MDKLKGYFWRPYKDCDYGLAVVAHNIKEAKQLGWKEHGRTYGNDERYIDIQCHLMQKVDLTGLVKPQVIDCEDNNFDGLKRGFYSYIETECPICKHMNLIRCKDGYVACEDCLIDKSLLEFKSYKHCRDCKYSRFDESVLEVVCAVNLIKGLRDTVTSLPPLRTCSAFERKEQEAH
jgi:phage FluMu protein Com